MSKLDDAAKIKTIDSNNAFDVASSQPEQLLYSDFNVSQFKGGGIENIVVVGMGGSALAALICRNWWDDELAVPFVVTRDYSLPGFVDKSTLVIVSSYSGNTEEALSALENATERGAQIVCMASGGKLEDLANGKGHPLLRLPAGLEPRMGVWYGVRILATLFDQLDLTKGAAEQLENIQPALAEAAKDLLPAIESSKNLAKQVAEQIYGNTAIIYSGPTLGAAAYKWKISFNESSKNLAWSNELPEFNHNELVGWAGHPTDRLFQVIELRSDLDHPQVQKRFEISNKLLAGKMPEPIVIQARGKTKIEQILWTIQLGDFASLYLAVLNGVDPTPVDIIEDLKQQLP